MAAEFEASLASASQRLVDASIVVVSNMSQRSYIDATTLWEIQAEVVWTLLSSLLRGVYFSEAGCPEARNAIQDGLIPILADDLLEAAFDWPENSEGLREAEYQGLLVWFARSEKDNGNTMRYISPQAGYQMMLDGSIPEDSLVGKLCRRIADATGEEGNSELIQGLFVQAGESYMKADIAGLIVSLIEAEKTR